MSGGNDDEGEMRERNELLEQEKKKINYAFDERVSMNKLDTRV